MDDNLSSPSVDMRGEDLDPSMSDGFRLIYNREVPIEVRNQIGNEKAHEGTLEIITVKILVTGPDDAPSVVRMEVASEADLFFHYQHHVDQLVYPAIQESQKLMVNMLDYPTVLIRMLNACIKEPHINIAIFTMQGEAEARLDFIQNMEYKFVELMFCSFYRSPEETIQAQITFRYNVLKQRLAQQQSRLNEIHSLVKVKNPSLLLQLQKSATLPGSHHVSSNGSVSTSKSFR